MISKKQLIAILDDVIKSKSSQHSQEDIDKLNQIRDALKNANTREQIAKVSIQLLRYFEVIYNMFKDT